MDSDGDSARDSRTSVIVPLVSYWFGRPSFVIWITMGLAACSVDHVRFTPPGSEGGPDAGSADANLCVAELCDGLDNDCNGMADDRAALGTASACPAASCVDVRDHNPASQSGRWWIAPGGVAPFEVYCDQVTDGGGWALVWRNHGGSKGGEVSNAALLARAAAGAGDAIVLPPKQALASAIHQKLFDTYWAATNREWIKITTLWTNAGVVVNDQHLRVVMNTTSMRAIFATPVGRCQPVTEPFRVVVNGTVDFGKTNLINHYDATTYGLASTGNGNEDLCGQPVTNLIDDPSAADDSLLRIDGSGSTNAIRHLFSYSHPTAGRDASRCLYSCWEGMLAHYDGWVWGVR